MRPRLMIALLVCVLLSLAACKRSADTKPLDQAGVGYSTIKSFEELAVTEDEVTQIVKARSAGINDNNLLELVKLARSHGAPFAEGFAVAGLRTAGMSVEGVMQLGRLNHLGIWAGEGQALLYAGFRESTVLELAQRRSQGLPTMSSPSLAKLRNAGFSEERILQAIRDGVTDAQVDAVVTPLPSPGGFRRQPHRRR